MARQFTKGIDLVRAQKERFAKLKLTREKGLKDIADAGRRDAIELLSGGFSKSQTRGAFARGSEPATRTDDGRRRRLSARQMANRRLAGTVPLLPINVRSGKLRDSIRLLQRSTSGVVAFDLMTQGVPYAKYILGDGGTKKMVARGFRAEVQRRQKARMAAFVKFYQEQQRKS